MKLALLGGLLCGGVALVVVDPWQQGGGGGGAFAVDPKLKTQVIETVIKYPATSSPSGEVALAASVSAYRKKLELSWRLDYPLNPGYDANLQTMALAYTPTAICKVAGYAKFLVGGTTKWGHTKIQLFEFAEPAVYNAELSDAELVSVDTVFQSSATDPRSQVNMLVANLGDPDEFFVQFWNSKDVYAIKLSTGAYAKIASSTADPTVMVVPELLNEHQVLYPRVHLDHGYIYVFARFENRTGQPIPILRDLDKDGVVDDALVVDSVGWDAYGLADHTRYLDL